MVEVTTLKRLAFSIAAAIEILTSTFIRQRSNEGV